MERAQLEAVLRATGCVQVVGGTWFLRNPTWSPAESARVLALMEQPDQRPAGEEGGWIGVATGGTSGGVKLARHDERTFTAAVAGLRAHFGLEQINAVDVLPPWHVSGLMARVRAAATGGEHCAWEWKRLEQGDRPRLAQRGDGWVTSLVPTQLQRLLQAPEAVAWLRGFRAIFVGGGPLWPELAEAAARAELPLAPSYGLTETAAMVAALRPEEFRRGGRGCGSALPHAQLGVTAEGAVRISGESVCRGYWPEWRPVRSWTTEDGGVLDARGHLQLLGRRDAVIITGGKKVAPEEIEAALRASGEFAEVAVIGLPDPEWGEVVVACHPTEGGRNPDTAKAAAALAPAQRPKRYLAINPWPANAQGKVNRAALRAAALQVASRACSALGS